MSSKTVNNNSTEHICDEDNDNKWRLLPGRDSNSTGEAKFECIGCGKEQFRGGWDSANWLDVGIPLTHAEIKLARRYAAKVRFIRTENVELRVVKEWVAKNAFIRPNGKYGIRRPKDIDVFSSIKNKQTEFEEFKIGKEVGKCSAWIDYFLDFLISRLVNLKKMLKRRKSEKKKQTK